MEEYKSFYDEERLDELVDDDSISPTEEAFMLGYLEAWKCSIFLKENSWNGKNIRKK